MFYQLNLQEAAEEYARYQLPLPAPLPDSAPLMTRISDAMFRARTLQLCDTDGQRTNEIAREEEKAFSLMREGLTSTSTTNSSLAFRFIRTRLYGGEAPYVLTWQEDGPIHRPIV